MTKRRMNFEVVPEGEYTDFSDREKKPFISSNTVLTAATGATASLATYAVTKIKNTTRAATINPTPTAPEVVIEEPINVLAQLPDTLAVTAMPEAIPTGFIADTSLDILTTALDPLVQILVSISFPIASVIMISACFFFMFGNSEKAWGMIMNAGLGYVLIQLSPLFLKILKDVGSAM